MLKAFHHSPHTSMQYVTNVGLRQPRKRKRLTISEPRKDSTLELLEASSSGVLTSSSMSAYGIAQLGKLRGINIAAPADWKPAWS